MDLCWWHNGIDVTLTVTVVALVRAVDNVCCPISNPPTVKLKKFLSCCLQEFQRVVSNRYAPAIVRYIIRFCSQWVNMSKGYVVDGWDEFIKYLHSFKYSVHIGFILIAKFMELVNLCNDGSGIIIPFTISLKDSKFVKSLLIKSGGGSEFGSADIFQHLVKQLKLGAHKWRR